MDEKYLSGLGAALILISFGVIISFIAVSGIEKKAAQENTTISFEQLGEFAENTPTKLKNSTAVQTFRNFVGDTVEDIKNKVVLENTTLHSELKNTTSTTEPQN